MHFSRGGEMADAADSKSAGGNTVRVRSPLPAPASNPRKSQVFGGFLLSWHSGRQNGGVTRWHPVALISCANCNQIVTIGISRESRRRPRRRIESPRRPRMFTRCRLDATAHGSHPATASPTAFPSLPARSAVSPQGKGSRLRPRRPTGADAGKGFGCPMSERATAHARPRPQGGTVPAPAPGPRSPRRGHRPGHGLDGSPEGDRATLPGFGSHRRPRPACSQF